MIQINTSKITFKSKKQKSITLFKYGIEIFGIYEDYSRDIHEYNMINIDDERILKKMIKCKPIFNVKYGVSINNEISDIEYHNYDYSLYFNDNDFNLFSRISDYKTKGWVEEIV